MQLEAGKYYKTRDGRKSGPMVATNLSDYMFTTDRENWYLETGEHAYDDNTINTGLDLIAEWPSETTSTPTLSPETIDHIAIDSLKFHIADRDIEPLQKEAFRIVLRYYGVSV